MKKLLFNFMIIFFVILHKANASTIDSVLCVDYKAAYECVQRIIGNANLNDSLANKSYCAIMLGNLWSITVKEADNYVLYYGFRLSEDGPVRKTIPQDDNLFAKLFELDQSKITQPINKKDGYDPFFRYCVMVDSLHQKKIEWTRDSKPGDEYSEIVESVMDYYYCYVVLLSIEDSHGKNVFKDFIAIPPSFTRPAHEVRSRNRGED